MSNQAEHVVVLYGGPSAETEVSKMSAQAVEKAYIEMGTSYTMLEYKSGEWIAELKALNPTFVFIAMHGTPGEDGSVQAVLDELNLPYNGSGMEASVVAMNKSLTKKVLERVQLPVAQEYLLKKGEDLPSTVTHTGLDFPLVVKPNNGGSSVGTEIVMSANAWPAAKERLIKFLEATPQDMLFEEFIDGRELTVPVFFDKTLGVLEITTEGYEFYDYTSKYSEGGSQHIYPASIATEVKEEAEYEARLEWGSIFVSLGVGIGIFFVLPSVVVQVGENMFRHRAGPGTNFKDPLVLGHRHRLHHCATKKSRRWCNRTG